ncbi:MAG: hypothetical protein ACYS99_19905, partial [Planctomycetota bacterium]|jgi:hypothetical protein
MVPDHDVEVGCYVAIADPVVQPVFSGWLVRAAPRVAPDGKTVLLDLRVRIQGIGDGPKVQALDEPVCGSLQVVRLSEREAFAEPVLRQGETVRLPLGRAEDGRPLEMEVRAAAE